MFSPPTFFYLLCQWIGAFSSYVSKKAKCYFQKLGIKSFLTFFKFFFVSNHRKIHWFSM